MSVFIWAIGIALTILVFLFPKGSKPMLTAKKAKLIRAKEAALRQRMEKERLNKQKRGHWEWVDEDVDRDRFFDHGAYDSLGVDTSFSDNDWCSSLSDDTYHR